MFPHVTPSKKIPRLLLAQNPQSLQPLLNIQALWPGRGISEVYDLSFGGMVISAMGHSSRIDYEKEYEFLLRIPGLEDPHPIKARIKRVTPQSFGLIFDNNLAEGRLALEQVMKDQIVSDNLRESGKDTLPGELQTADLWLHGPFDTNVILWKKPGTAEIQKALIEYDNVTWIYDNGELIVQRSFTAVDEEHGYFNVNNLSDPKKNKVSMGASWLDRLLKLLTKVALVRGGDLVLLLDLLKKQKAR